MLATSITYVPLLKISRFTKPSSSSSKPLSFETSKALTIDFHGSFLRTTLYEKNRFLDVKTMSSASKISHDDEERIEVMETEAILSNGSSEFHRNIVSGGDGGIHKTLNRLSKWLVAAIFGTIVIWRHDAVTLWAATGAVLNSSLSVTLKRILNQERPISTLRADPGMPSSHAQSIFFASVYAILSLVKWVGFNQITISVGVLVLGFSSYLSWLRVSQRLHTISQVIVGAVLGTICSILWFQLWYAFVLKAFVSFLWVRIAVVLGSVILCLSFLLYVIRHWLMDEELT